MVQANKILILYFFLDICLLNSTYGQKDSTVYKDDLFKKFIYYVFENSSKAESVAIDKEVRLNKFVNICTEFKSDSLPKKIGHIEIKYRTGLEIYPTVKSEPKLIIDFRVIKIDGLRCSFKVCFKYLSKTTEGAIISSYVRCQVAEYEYDCSLKGWKIISIKSNTN